MATFTKEDRDAAIEKAQAAYDAQLEEFEKSRARFEAHVEKLGRRLYNLRVAELIPVDGVEIPIQAPCVHDDTSAPKGVKLIIPPPPTADAVTANIDERLGTLPDVTFKVDGQLESSAHAGEVIVTTSPVNPFASPTPPANPFAAAHAAAAEAMEGFGSALARLGTELAPTTPSIDERAQAASAAALARNAEQEREHALAGLPEEKRARVAAALAGPAPTPPANPFAGM